MKYFKYLDLNIASVIVIIFYVVLISWWFFIQYIGITDSNLNYLFALLYGFIPFIGGLYSLLRVFMLREKKLALRNTVTFFSLGLIFWGVGEFIWAYYNYQLHIEIPYPSFADLSFMLSYPLWTVSLFYFANLVGLDISAKSKFSKLLFIAFSVFMIFITYYLLSMGGSAAFLSSKNSAIKLFFDISYPIWDVVLVVIILIINSLAFDNTKGRLRTSLICVTIGLILSFFADLGFTYQTSDNAFFNGNFVDLFYLSSVSFITLAVTILLSEEEVPFISTQSSLLQQREEELKEVNIKLHERDELLSRINKELYKKNLELIEEKRKAEALIYSVNEAVIVLDNQEKIVLFNRAAADLTGLNESESSGKPFSDLLNIVDEHSAMIDSERIKESLGYRQGSKLSNLILKRSDGKERYVNLTASKVLIDKDINLYVLIISDVTEEKHSEKAREEFISIASHELRTPMTIIKNYLWMLQNNKGGTLTDKQLEYVKKATEGTERMIKLIHDMLDVSRMEQGRMEFHPTQVNIGSLTAEITADFKIKADQKGLALSLGIADNLPKVRADEDKLREVIINIIGNSLKYTDKGFVKVEVIEEGKNVKFSVVDSGKGISKEDLPKLFHKFGRLDNSFVTAAESGGTGLGLYIVKSIIEAMGGKVGVFSEGVDKGSTFWFTLRSADREVVENAK